MDDASNFFVPPAFATLEAFDAGRAALAQAAQRLESAWAAGCVLMLARAWSQHPHIQSVEWMLAEGNFEYDVVIRSPSGALAHWTDLGAAAFDVERAKNPIAFSPRRGPVDPKNLKLALQFGIQHSKCPRFLALEASVADVYKPLEELGQNAPNLATLCALACQDPSTNGSKIDRPDSFEPAELARAMGLPQVGAAIELAQLGRQTAPAPKARRHGL